MSRKIFINLPVSDLPRSLAFYEAIGFTKDPRFSNDQAAAMDWSEHIKVMLLSHDFWKTFTSKAIVDAKASAQVALCISLDSRADVDGIVEAAAAAGGTGDANPAQDHGFMYQRSFEDPDGHAWEPMWMDEAFAPGDAQKEPAQ
jgi:predicted lactoylglutathione lyase